MDEHSTQPRAAGRVPDSSFLSHLVSPLPRLTETAARTAFAAGARRPQARTTLRSAVSEDGTGTSRWARVPRRPAQRVLVRVQPTGLPAATIHRGLHEGAEPRERLGTIRPGYPLA